MRNVIIVSYFTENYAEIVKGLKRSLREIPIQNYIGTLRDRGSWQKNTIYKARFIQKMMSRYPEKGIIFTDADSIVRKDPVLFDRLFEDGVDFAAHLRTWRRGRIVEELLSGTVYFGPTQIAAQLVKRWIAENRNHPQMLEQRNLGTALRGLSDAEKDLKFWVLPVEYCTVFDGDDRPKDPVIEHFQASRKMRKR